MKGFNISFNIYAETEDEAKDAQQAFMDFIDSQALEGRAVSANKIIEAMELLNSNVIYKMAVNKFFK